MQELKMQELKNLFFYTFGIVPLQNYGVIGDGMTDNRLKIQQAIYDAIEVGAKYIFVPQGEYFYDENKLELEQPSPIVTAEKELNQKDGTAFPCVVSATSSERRSVCVYRA